MRHTEEKLIPARISKVTTKITCDFPDCNREISQQQGDLKEVTIKYETGYRYPEGGSGHTHSIDVCHKCFLDKVAPWFKSQGVHFIESDWDF